MKGRATPSSLKPCSSKPALPARKPPWTGESGSIDADKTLVSCPWVADGVSRIHRSVAWAAVWAAVSDYGLAGAVARERDCGEGQAGDVLADREVCFVDRGDRDERGYYSKADMVDVVADGAHVDQRGRHVYALGNDVEACRDDEDSCATRVSSGVAQTCASASHVPVLYRCA